MPANQQPWKSCGSSGERSENSPNGLRVLHVNRLPNRMPDIENGKMVKAPKTAPPDK